MASTITTTTVAGKIYKVWSDYIVRATFAENENGEVKAIKRSGYLSNDLAVRKAIASTFGLATFRK